MDVKGDAYEELLAKSAEDIKTGAGQYFTPRALISAMVDCIQPGLMTRSSTRRAVPAASCLPPTSTSRSVTAAELTPEQRDRLAAGAITGAELVDGTARLAAMNMLLHGIGEAERRRR